MIWFVRAARAHKDERTEGRGKRHVQSLCGVGNAFAQVLGWARLRMAAMGGYHRKGEIGTGQ